MAHVIVTTDDGGTEFLRENVQPVHLEDEHISLQIIERVAWAVNDAESYTANMNTFADARRVT